MHQRLLSSLLHRENWVHAPSGSHGHAGEIRSNKRCRPGAEVTAEVRDDPLGEVILNWVSVKSPERGRNHHRQQANTTVRPGTLAQEPRLAGRAGSPGPRRPRQGTRASPARAVNEGRAEARRPQGRPPSISVEKESLCYTSAQRAAPSCFSMTGEWFTKCAL